MSLSDIFDTGEKPKRKKKIAPEDKALVIPEQPDDNDPEYIELKKRSKAAVLRKPIEATRKLELDNESKIVKLKIEAGNLMRYEEGRFLFFGFFEKASRDWQRVSKRNKPILKNLVAEGDLDGVMDLYDAEIVAIIKGLKGEAKKQVAAWRRELKEGK